MNPVIFDKKDHNISKDQLNNSVISILEKLKKANFQAYIVGGGVRDLLLGYKPKDIDIATDARPEQIRALFRNSRIIGRRFRLVHIHFGREIIEVATFRATPKDTNDEGTDLNSDHFTESGRILRDNIYGNIEDDIWRRDFSVNALYYDAIEETIIDYCGGYDDLKAHTLKILGDPSVRYREDPVRMLRALRFSAKLDFTIDKKTLAPIKDTKFQNLLDDIPRARLFEEYNKLFLTGYAEKSFYLLNKYNLFNKMFPFTATQGIEEQFPQHLSFLHAVLKSTDKRAENDQPINPAFLIAAFLWHPLAHEFKKSNTKQTNKEFLWRQAAHTIMKKQNAELSIPKRFIRVIEDIWYLQRLFNKKNIKSLHKIAEHPKFRAGFDFLNIRADVEVVNEPLLKWWQKYEAASDSERKALLKNYEKPSA